MQWILIDWWSTKYLIHRMFHSIAILPAIPLFLRIKNFPSLRSRHDKLSNFWQASSFQVHTSVQKHLWARISVENYFQDVHYSLIARHQRKGRCRMDFNLKFHSVPIKAVWFKADSVFAAKHRTHEFAKKIISVP